jgi:hypothetical protein
MIGNHLLTALSTAVALGTAGASVAQASFNDSGEYHGGFKVGPLGQRFPAQARFFSYAYAPHRRHWHRHHYEYYR